MVGAAEARVEFPKSSGVSRGSSYSYTLSPTVNLSR
jgi:hypothetical protein